jgi:iron complex transport system ATP-binding protein
VSCLRLENVGHRYGEREVLRAISFRLQHGEQVALLGPNGAGKSTLLRLCAGLRPGHSGRVMLEGMPLASAPELADRVVFVAQEQPALGDLRAIELVLTGLAPIAGGWASGGDAGRDRAMAAMETTGTLDLAGRSLATLSGGELRRVLLARALLREPRLLLLDEPLASLDLGAQGRVLELLQVAASRGAAVLVALHDINLARRFFGRALLLCGGELVGDGAPEEVLSVDRVQQAFGAAEIEGGFFFPRRQVAPASPPEGGAS